MQVLCGLQGIFLLFNCQTPEKLREISKCGISVNLQGILTYRKKKDIILSLTVVGRKKSLYPLYLLGYSDFCRCFGL